MGRLYQVYPNARLMGDPVIEMLILLFYPKAPSRDEIQHRFHPKLLLNFLSIQYTRVARPLHPYRERETQP